MLTPEIETALKKVADHAAALPSQINKAASLPPDTDLETFAETFHDDYLMSVRHAKQLNKLVLKAKELIEDQIAKEKGQNTP